MFEVHKKGIGLLFCQYPEEVVATYPTWKLAFNKVQAMAMIDTNFYYFMCLR